MDLKLSVTPTNNFNFVPDELIIRTVSTDIAAGKATIYYELKETTLDNSRYISREWVDKGNVEVPLALLAGATDANGNINPAIINQFLAAFNLSLNV
jgi:hypothetical protein